MKDSITINIKPVKSSVESLKTFISNVNIKDCLNQTKQVGQKLKAIAKFQKARITFMNRFSKSGVVKDILDKVNNKQPLEDWEEFILNEFNKKLNK